ncbi:ferric reductase-like transmembrane domain-containing protein [Kitasatospora sp. NPDC127111]|uniref:ferric reductase-like transmembrane domain-containing protein n=1 Tax=Kitasatospora sp. NPDC127111 TaxID=3345363 RepID=UPI00362984E4
MTTTTTLAASPLWYAGRAGGTTALLLLTATVALGIAVGGKAVPLRVGRFEINLLHRNLAVLSLAFLALHIATAVIDPYARLTWADAVLPFGAAYRPLWLGLGSIGFDLLLAVAITSALRLRIGRRRWKAVHWLAYAAWPIGLLHAIGTGTDTRLPFQLWLYASCLATVASATGWRLYRAGPGHLAARLGAGLLVAALPVLVTAFLAAGPLQPGWSQRAALHTLTALEGAR